MKLRIALLSVCLALLTGCPQVQVTAYRTVVGAKAFIASVQMQHPECVTAPTALCTALKKATAAKDAMIDAAEVYCSGPAFDNNGGACTPPGDPTVKNQLATKIQSAISNYNQTVTDLKGILK